MKRVLALLAVVACIATGPRAFAFCTQTSISSGSSTQILAGNTSSSSPTRYLFVTVGGACGVWCSPGDTAAEGKGFYFGPGGTIPESWFVPVQLPPNSFPQSLNTAVNCFLPSNQTCASTTVSACRQ